jgi:DNA helicase-2/ATP-dependent DNA helicase PcrA
MLPLAIALEMGVAVRATARLLLEEPILDDLLAEAIGAGPPSMPLLLRLAAIRDSAAAEGAPADPDEPDPREVAAALLGWATAHPGDGLEAFAARVRDARSRLAALRSDDARLILATAHGTKGLEFDEVAVIGMDDGRFPSERTLAEAHDPERVLEEERRLAYVAWTRAKRVLTLVYDPLRPSPFLLEAFSREELNLPRGAGVGREPVGRARRESSSAGGGHTGHAGRVGAGSQRVDLSHEVGTKAAPVGIVQPARLDAIE